LGQRIRKARLERDLLQTDIARELGVDEMTIVNWERDRTKPIKMYRNRLKEYLGIVV